MANVFAIHSVGNSIVTYLRNSYPQALAGLDMPACAFELVSSGELAGEPGDATRITLYLYRITVNEHSRQVHAASAATARPTPLGLDLHFLMSAWVGNARDEHTIVAWAIRQLHMFPPAQPSRSRRAVSRPIAVSRSASSTRSRIIRS
jgi:hypothetical protein